MTIKSVEQCKQIQKRRVAAGKLGTAKAVRRFLKTQHEDKYSHYKSIMPKTFVPDGKLKMPEYQGTTIIVPPYHYILRAFTRLGAKVYIKDCERNKAPHYSIDLNSAVVFDNLAHAKTIRDDLLQYNQAVAILRF